MRDEPYVKVLDVGNQFTITWIEPVLEELQIPPVEDLSEQSSYIAALNAIVLNR